MAGGAIRIAHYDVIDDVITRKLQETENQKAPQGGCGHRRQHARFQ